MIDFLLFQRVIIYQTVINRKNYNVDTQWCSQVYVNGTTVCVGNEVEGNSI